VDLRDSWERHAADWIRWAREPGHDSYWRVHREPFLGLVPSRGRVTLDVGCGEGRVSRDLRLLGHRVIGVDASETMVAAAREADPDGEYVVGNAAALPFSDEHADLVVAFMSLMDVDDMPGAVRELARVLEPGGRLVLAVVHPINSAHELDREHPEHNLVLVRDYFDRRRYTDVIERKGLRMTFDSRHWTFQDYFDAILEAGFRVEALREVADPDHPRWSRYPLFLHIRAVVPPGSGLAPPQSGDESGTSHPPPA
jgi:ubiquinone/menaquinone biosynthesis C-methylase UbiE